MGYLMSLKYSHNLKETQVHFFLKDGSEWASKIIWRYCE